MEHRPNWVAKTCHDPVLAEQRQLAGFIKAQGDESVWIEHELNYLVRCLELMLKC